MKVKYTLLTVTYLALFTFLIPPLSGQTIDKESFQNTLSYMDSVDQQLLTLAFIPGPSMDYSDRNWNWTALVVQLPDAPEAFPFQGMDLDGLGLGFTALFALNDRWSLYSSYNGLYLRGVHKGSGGSSIPESDWTGSWNTHHLLGGIRLELLEEDGLTLPLSLGIKGSWHSHTMDSSSVPVLSEYWDIRMESSGLHLGAYGSLSAVLDFGSLSLTPYLFLQADFSPYSASISGDIANTGAEAFPSEEWNQYPGYSLSMGLDLAYSLDSQWSFGASLMNFLPFLRTSYEKGKVLSMLCFLCYSP